MNRIQRFTLYYQSMTSPGIMLAESLARVLEDPNIVSMIDQGTDENPLEKAVAYYRYVFLGGPAPHWFQPSVDVKV